MAEEDYEIDVYGDAQDGGQEQQQHAGAEDYGDNTHMDGAPEPGDADHETHNGNENDNDNGEQSNDQSASGSSAPQHGVKRKSEPDDRPVDPNATAALLISELQWWNTEDEVRNWVHDAACEDELKEITFSEHKVNGKSKGCVQIHSLCYSELIPADNSCPTDKPTSSLRLVRLQPQRSDT